MKHLAARNVHINGKRTSVRLERHMWESLKDIAKREKSSVDRICTTIFNAEHKETTLTAAIRVFIMLYYKAAATEEGHKKAGHGCFNKMIHRKEVLESTKLDGYSSIQSPY